MKFLLNKLKPFVQNVIDRATGAEEPVLYYERQGPMQQILKQLPQLKQKYRPTPWLSNNHVHL